MSGPFPFPTEAAHSSALHHGLIRTQRPGPGLQWAAAEHDAATKPSSESQSVTTPHRKKAGVLAAAGLIILSLLVLATGLALLRAFRQR